MRRTAWVGRARALKGRVRDRCAREGAHTEDARTLCGANARCPGAVRVVASHARRGTSPCDRWQFVLDIDEQLFASFAPRNLKRALAKSAELVRASVSSFHGLDLAPVLKLAAALTMVGCLLGTIVVPQNALLTDAESTLCGACRAHLLLRSARPAAPQRIRRAQAGRSAGRGQKTSSASRSGST